MNRFVKAKRVLVFNDSLALAGTEKLLISLLSYLVAKNCEVTLMLPVQTDKNVLLSDVSQGVKIIYLFEKEESLFKRKKEEIRMIFKTASFLKSKKIFERDYDEVVCFKEGFYAKLFSRWVVPNILWIHNILYERKYEVRTIKEALAVWLNKKEIIKVQESYAYYNKVVCVSESCKSSYLKAVYEGCLPIQDIRVIPNAIDYNKVVELAKERASVLFNQNKINFILLTRLSPDKRIDRILKSSARLMEEGYDFVVHIMGEGTNSKEVQEEVQRLGLEDMIRLYGEVRNPFPYIKQANWSICVSQRESFSLVLLESMKLDVPVITTDCGGPTQIVDNGKYGILVENSTEGVYGGMKSVLSDKGLSEKYSMNFDKALKRYDLDHWYQAVGKVLSI